MYNVLLVGNPNSGKTTIFNALTGSSERVGNWHGVTVNAAIGRFKWEGKEISITDLPGLYSINGGSMEETVSIRHIFEGNHLIVNVIEGVNLKRSLILTKELISAGKRVAVLITMRANLEKRGGRINIKGLSDYLGCPCAFADNVNVGEWIAKCINTPQPANSIFDDLPNNVLYLPKRSADTILDKVLLNPISALPIFAVIMCAVLYLTFGKYGLGEICGALLSNFIKTTLCGLVETTLEFLGVWQFLTRLICEGALCGMADIIGFVPQLAVMYCCLIILEESGILSRVAFIFDGVLKLVGLSGKAIFPLLIGFGCTATAVVASRATESKSVQKRTVLATYFISCSARMPIFMYIASAFFSDKAFLVVVTIYCLGVAIGVCCAAISFKLSGDLPEPFVLELPEYKIPSIKTVLKQLNYYLKTFIIKIGTVIFAVSVILWLLRTLSPSFDILDEKDISQSILAKIGGVFSFIFAPIGCKGWQLPVAAICGLIAKESVVSALALIYPMGIMGGISPQTAIAFLVFSAYYTPCVAAISSTRAELDSRLSAFYAVFSFMLALLLSYIIYGIMSVCVMFGYSRIVGGALVGVILAISVKIIIKSIKNKRCGCDAQNICGCARKTCKNCGGKGGTSLFCRQETFAGKGYKT